ncbi:MAG: DUF58 domain-containing protein [Treponema sp.]|jgi:uncharacterized protein (DUF58 family)|nr:DUF58 domain-containing protein [Treponema sp.]
MEASELLRSINTLPVISGGLAEEMLAGNFRSIFKGQGMEFDEARHYEPGDDIRSIDWNASARFGSPFVKMYREERELTILILMDISPSMHRGHIARQGLSPYEQALISAALIAFSAEHTDQQVGAFFFDRGIEKVFPPHKGRRHIMALIMAALHFQNKVIHRRNKSGSNIASALAGAQRLLKRRSLVVVISDFFSINWENEMARLCRKHDCIALRICDPPDLPYPGLITMEDPETGIKIEVPAGMDSFIENWAEWKKERSVQWESQCRRTGASFLELPVTADASASLIKFFATQGRYKQKRK